VTSGFQLAQANVARMRGALEDPVMAGFVARLESLNALADASPGFVWRYQTDAGDATEVRVFDDELILFNLSVWESVERLEDYVYRSNHVEALQKRAEWFERSGRAPFVLWWIEAGHIPSVEEAKARFDVLWRDGSGVFVFTFRERFAAPAT
jgi:hypothetical protein